MDLETEELKKNGRKLRLKGQAFKVLAILVERAPRVVTRQELQSQLWSQDIYVDFDRGLNNSILKIRETLGDSAGNPRFIETIPRKGYRFLGSIERDCHQIESGVTAEGGGPSERDAFSTELRSLQQRLFVAVKRTELAVLEYQVQDLIARYQGHESAYQARLLLDCIQSAQDHIQRAAESRAVAIRVSPKTAARVFDDPDALSVSDGFGRWRTVGAVAPIVVVVDHVMNEGRGKEIIRVIAARKATPEERRTYEKKKRQNS